MKFTWDYTETSPLLLKKFIHSKGISRGLLAKIKFQGGFIEVNNQEENVRYQLKQHDVVTVTIPDEKEHETLLVDDTPIDIVFEDDHLLVVNKPSDVASIPAQYHPKGTMANRVKGYLKSKNYPNQVVHVVTRLDRDTTGLMLFAKHGYAHAMMDKQLQSRTLHKKYQALVMRTPNAKTLSSGLIDLPIKRDPTSIIKRMTGEDGLVSLTEYEVEKTFTSFSLVNIQLHTGRTHQIRVHFSAIGYPLLGDDLYGGSLELGIQRQALHCGELSFTHPYTNEKICLTQKLPEDMKKLVGR